MSEQLPTGWEWATIDDLLATQQDGRTIHQGWSPKCESTPAPVDAWGVLKTTAIQPGEFQPQHNKELPTSKEPRLPLEVAEGDLLLTCAGPRSRCGVAALVRRARPKLLISGKMYRLRFDRKHVLPEYIEAYLLSAEAWAFIDGLKTGGNESGLNLTQTRFRTLPVPFAPRPEQERIVTAIEEHLSGLDAAGQSIKTVTEHLRSFREAIEVRMLGAERVRVPLGELAELVTDGDHRPPPRVPEGVPHLTAKHIRHGLISFENCTYVSEDGYRQTAARYEPQARDVIVTCVGTVGEVAVVPPGVRFSADRNLAAIRMPRSSEVEPEWIAAVLATSQYRRLMTTSSGSTAQPHLYLKDLRQLPVPVPRPGEQIQVLAEIAEFDHLMSRVRDACAAAQRRSADLRRSILAAAFSGQLIAQDPADEPASVLLQRIAAERPSPKTRRKTSA